MHTRGLVAVVFLAIGMTVGGQEPGTSAGGLVVGSSRVALAHAYAFAERGDERKEQYRLLITDKPLSGSAVKDEFARRQLLLERKVQGLEIVLDAARNVVSANLYHPDLPGSGLAVSGMNAFKADAFDGQKIAGTVFTERAFDHFGKSIEYKATFTTQVTRRPAITAAELGSPAGKAATAFLKAAAASDARALRTILTAEALKELDGPDGTEILKMLPELVPPTMKITAIDVSGETAVVLAEDGKEKVKVRFRVVRENGQWKVTLPEG